MPINLLPPDIKRSYHYAILNQKLLQRVIALIFSLVGLGIIGTYGWIVLRQESNSNNHQIIVLKRNLTAEHLTATENKVQTISNDFSLVVKVLSHEVMFSKLLSQMAEDMPLGANLTSLNITATSKGSGLDISAEATNYITATQIQINLSNPMNGIFSKVDLNNINCTNSSTNSASTNSANSAYPCTVNLRAQFAPNNSFMFINQKGTN